MVSEDEQKIQDMNSQLNLDSNTMDAALRIVGGYGSISLL